MKRIAHVTPTAYKELTQNPLFTPAILANSQLHIFEAKEYIHRQGAAMTALYYVITGSAKILKTETNGKRTLIQFLKPGDFIGELAFIEAESSQEETKDVQARTQVVCLAIPMTYAKDMLFEDPHFLQKIGQYIGRKLIDRMAHFSINQNFELRDRLAEFLIEQCIEDQVVEKQTEIAEYLGVSYRHLAHTMKEFRQLELIEKQHNEYHIDRQKVIAYQKLRQ